MDLDTLKDLVNRSSLLSPAEREYWLRNLPQMTDRQCKKLQSILDVPDEFPFQSQMEQFFGAFGQAAEAALAHTPPRLAA